MNSVKIIKILAIALLSAQVTPAYGMLTAACRAATLLREQETTSNAPKSFTQAARTRRFAALAKRNRNAFPWSNPRKALKWLAAAKEAKISQFDAMLHRWATRRSATASYVLYYYAAKTWIRMLPLAVLGGGIGGAIMENICAPKEKNETQRRIIERTVAVTLVGAGLGVFWPLSIPVGTAYTTIRLIEWIREQQNLERARIAAREAVFKENQEALRRRFEPQTSTGWIAWLLGERP